MTLYYYAFKPSLFFSKIENNTESSINQLLLSLEIRKNLFEKKHSIK